LTDDCLIFGAQITKIETQKESVLKVNSLVFLNFLPARLAGGVSGSHRTRWRTQK